MKIVDNLTAVINKVEYKLTSSLVLTEQLGKGCASQIDILIEDGYPIPTGGDIVEVYVGAIVVFLGVCGIPTSPTYVTGHEVKIYRLVCNSANSILARRVANVAFKNYTVTQIVKALYEKYIKAEGFRLGVISEIPIRIGIYTASDFDLKYVLDELAEHVGGVWHCTTDRFFHFIAQADFPSFQKEINENFNPFGQLQKTIDMVDTRTNQIISGATSRTDPQTERHVFREETETLTVSFGIAERPSISVNDIPIQPQNIGVAGLDGNVDSVVFLFSFNSPILTYNKQNTIRQVKDGDIIEITYIGIYQIRTETRNYTEIDRIAQRTGTSGIIDNVRIDRTVQNANDAIQLSQALLLNHGTERIEITVETSSEVLKRNGIYLSDLSTMFKLSISLPSFDIVGDYVIVERAIKPNVIDGVNTTFTATLKLVDRGFLRSYGQVFDDLNKNLSLLSFREDEIIVDVSNFEETVDLSETILTNIRDDFFPAYCTSGQSGDLMHPVGLNLYMIEGE